MEPDAMQQELQASQVYQQSLSQEFKETNYAYKRQEMQSPPWVSGNKRLKRHIEPLNTLC